MAGLKHILYTAYTMFEVTATTAYHKLWCRSITVETGDESVEGKIVVITGGSNGIGLAVATELARRKATVVMACRNMEKTERVIENIKKIHPGSKLIAVELDVSDLQSVRRCAGKILEKFPHVNILINNAGIMLSRPKIERTEEGFERHLVTNHLGHFLFTLLLIGHLKKGSPSRIVTVASTGARAAILDLHDLNWEKPGRPLGTMYFQPYATSKLANFLFSRELGKRLEGSGIQTYAMCPGAVNTDISVDYPKGTSWLAEKMTQILIANTEQGGETVLYCALSQDVSQETSKAYRHRANWQAVDGELQDEDASEIWELSEKMVNYKWSQVDL